MTRLNVLLVLALMASCLYLVKVSYDARRLFTSLERSQADGRNLEADYKRLDAERQGQATNLRVEKVARDKLAMRPATPAVTQYVTDSVASAVSGVKP